MILSERKPFGVIKAELEERGFKKVAVLACNGCARFCETGGQKYLDELGDRLENEGFTVIKKLVPMLCDIDMIKREITKEDIESADCIISLGCLAGEYAIKKLFPEKTIVEGVDTIGLAIRDEEGNIFLVKDLRDELEEVKEKILK